MPPKSDLPQGTLDLLILKTVAMGPVHGYAIGQRLQQISRDVVQVPQGSLYPALHRPANFIERALASLEQSLVIAAILILAVLYLFLRDWRSALITFLAIPLSLLAAVAVLERMGQTLNTMTLGGFAVALGVLVDDAIIGIENTMRRLRENQCNRISQTDIFSSANNNSSSDESRVFAGMNNFRKKIKSSVRIDAANRLDKCRNRVVMRVAIFVV